MGGVPPDFDVDIKYIQGPENGLADAFSRVEPTRRLAKREDDPRSFNVGFERAKAEHADKPAEGSKEVSAITRRQKAADKGALEPQQKLSNAVEETRQVRPKPRTRRGTMSPRGRSRTAAQHIEQVLLDRQAEKWRAPDEAAVQLDSSLLRVMIRAIEQQYQTVSFFSKAEDVENARLSNDSCPTAPTGFTLRRVDADTRAVAVYHQREGHYRLCIPEGVHNGRNLKEIVLEHFHTVLGHSGVDKMMHSLQTQYWWPSMRKLVQSYSDSCPSCQACKRQPGKFKGLTHALPVPTLPWHTVGIDFIGPLPRSILFGVAHDCLLVVVDHFSGETELIPCSTTSTGQQVACC